MIFFGVKSWFFTRNTPNFFAPPSAIGKNMIFWRKIVIFHTKYPQKFRASLRSAQFFLVPPPTWNPGSPLIILLYIKLDVLCFIEKIRFYVFLHHSVSMNIIKSSPVIKLLTFPEHLSSPSVFSGVRVTRTLVLCVCFVDRCLSFCTF
jgi:hypothetical protein